MPTKLGQFLIFSGQNLEKVVKFADIEIQAKLSWSNLYIVEINNAGNLDNFP